MLVQLLDVLFSSANSVSVFIGAALPIIWLAALGCYIGLKVAAYRRSRASANGAGSLSNVDSLDSNLVAKAPARI